MKIFKHFWAVSALAAAAFATTAARADIITYEFSFTAADLLNYTYVAGADGSTAAENGLYDGARLARTDGYIRSYVSSQHSAFSNWATTTDDKLTTVNLWGFDGRGAGWGEDYKHLSEANVSNTSGWTDWDTGWSSSWGPNPNPNTDKTAGWYANDIASSFGFGDVDLADQVFTFDMTFDTNDWLYGANTYGAPNTLGGPMTFWFGGWMGDADNMYQYIYEGNLVLTGTAVPAPGSVFLLGIGLALFGLSRIRRVA